MWPHIILTTFLLATTAYNGEAQRVEFISPPATLSTTSYISPITPPTFQPAVQPAGQFVIPAIIKPLLSPSDIAAETCAPTVPSFPNFNGNNGFEGFNGVNGFNDFNGFNGFGGGSNGLSYPPFIPHPMPIYCNDDDNDWHHLLYFLLFANRFGLGGFGGGSNGYGYGYGGYGGYGGYNGGYGGGCGCGCGGGCSCDCGRGGGCSYDCGCGGSGGDCGCGCGCGFQENCGCGCNEGFNNGVTYVPYPIAVPINYANGLPSFDDTLTIIEDTQVPTFQLGGTNGNELSLLIKTENAK